MSLFDAEMLTQVRKSAHEAAEFEGWMARNLDDDGQLPEGLAAKAATMKGEIEAAAARIVAMLPERSTHDIALEIGTMAAGGADNAVGLLTLSRLVTA